MPRGRTEERAVEDADDGELASARSGGRLLSAWGFVVFFGAIPVTFVTWLLFAMARRDVMPWSVVAVGAALSAALWVVGIPLSVLVKRGSSK